MFDYVIFKFFESPQYWCGHALIIPEGNRGGFSLDFEAQAHETVHSQRDLENNT